jgi:hypothetical protein
MLPKPECKIVFEDLWEQVQVALEARNEKYPGRKTKGQLYPSNSHTNPGKHLLTGGVFACAECGGPFSVVKTNSTGVRYGCSTYAHSGTCHPKPCSNSVTKVVSEANQAVLDAIRQHLIDDDDIAYILDCVRKKVANMDGFADSARHDLVRESKGLERKLHNLLDLIERGSAAKKPKSLMSRIDEYEGRIAEIEAELESKVEPPPPVKVVEATVRQYIDDLAVTLDKRPEKARHVLQNLIKDGKYHRLGYGKAEISFTLCPLGTTHRVAVLSQRRSSRATPSRASSSRSSTSSPGSSSGSGSSR